MRGQTFNNEDSLNELSEISYGTSASKKKAKKKKKKRNLNNNNNDGSAITDGLILGEENSKDSSNISSYKRKTRKIKVL